LVQKKMYPGVDSVVHVYAPDGPDVTLHLERIKAFNTRSENPTHWQEKAYKGSDFFEKMTSEKSGNVVVLAGNNQKKTEYISKSIEAGFHVLADKPMVIDGKNFKLLESAFEKAKQKNLLLYDIMTERSEITTILQRELSMIPEVFGAIEKGSPENPSITKESVHHFYKFVSGTVLTRPAWFFDVNQEGEGIVDVSTHLVDLVQWECYPEQALDYKKDVSGISGKRTATEVTLSQFREITKLESFPGYLKTAIVNDTILKVYSNGEINYKLKDIYAKVSVKWNYKAPEGAGDTHYSIMRGTKANLVIRQGAEQQYKPSLYIEPTQSSASYQAMLAEKIKAVQAKYPGVDLKKNANGWEVIIPDKYHEGHEAHFGRVMERFVDYLQKGNIPKWEVPNMLTKYYITTQAFEMSR
jgi:predicted dehydrogenase